MMGIGGYPQLELSSGEEYHKKALSLNTGRNALELILRTRKYTKVYLPFYTCDVVLEPFHKLNKKYEFYSINNDLEPLFDYSAIKIDEGFLYTNYFGIKDSFVAKLRKQCRNLIIDNSHAFYAKPIKNTDTFYSCRKFFGVPDGAYLYMPDTGGENFPLDVSGNRFSHLIKRIEFGPVAGYEDFKVNETKLANQPIMRMSKLTKSLLKNINYRKVKNTRQRNFLLLHECLAQHNELKITYKKVSVPMAYPFLSDNSDLRQVMIKSNIFVAQYWPNVVGWQLDQNAIETQYSTKLCALPIHQSLSEDDMRYISKKVLSAATRNAA